MNRPRTVFYLQSLVALVLLSASLIWPAVAGADWNVCAFKVEGLNEDKKDGQIIRKLKLTLVQNIKGEKRESFELRVTREDQDRSILSMREPPVLSAWFKGGLEGETVIVEYMRSIEMPSSLTVGKQYLDDITFVVTSPKELDVAARRQILDQYLSTHRQIFSPVLVRYIAELVGDSKITKEVWAAYVKGNPLGLKDALHRELFDDLSGMVDIPRDFVPYTDSR